MRDTLARFGRVDSCFANAGMSIAKPLVEMTRADFNAVLDVNLTGVFLTFREAVRHMIARGGGGKLIATSSIGSMHGMPRHAAEEINSYFFIAVTHFHRFVAVASCGMGPMRVVPATPGSVC